MQPDPIAHRTSSDITFLQMGKQSMQEQMEEKRHLDLMDIEYTAVLAVHSDLQTDGVALRPYDHEASDRSWLRNQLGHCSLSKVKKKTESKDNGRR